MSVSQVAMELRTIPVANKNGVRKEAPAVHAMWAETRVWTPYWPPGTPQQLAMPGASDSWMNMAAAVDADLGWLLRRKAHRFWSQICHDDGLHQWLESLLETFPRSHEPNSEVALVESRQQQLLHRLFLVFVRLCTYKESTTDFFTPEYYGNMIYDKFLIEVPKILDICVLFGPCNPMITSRMVGNIFRCQPQYLEDLVTAGETMSAAMDSVGEQFQALQHSSCSSDPGPAADLVSYVGDIASTLAALMEAHQPAGLALHQAGLLVKLPAFYHSLVVPLQTHAAHLAVEGEPLVRRLSLARHQLIAIFRSVIDVVSLSPLLGGGEAHGEPLEELLTILTSVLSERSFILDYNAKFPIRLDFDLIEGLGKEIDPTRKHYILDAFTGTVTHSFTDVKTTKKQSKKGEAEKVLQHEASVVPPDGASCLRPKEVEVESLISSVRDMLPHLGEGFVERCLESYAFQPAEVINAVLEGNLAPHLAELDQAMGREKKKTAAAEPIVPRSVYEEDEFDVNTQDHIDMSRVHKGKRNKVKDAKKMLDDKSDLTWDLKDKFSKLGIVMDEVYVARGDAMDNAYDDEYDDTYDDVPVGQQEPDAAEEGRTFVLPVALGGGKIRQERREQDDDDDDEDEEEENPNRKPNFVRNPEEIRAEKERKWQERSAQRGGRRGGRGGGGGGGQGGGGGPDVVGRARGQGQDKSVLIARRRKNDNKGKGQRVGADRKAARGMF